MHGIVEFFERREHFFVSFGTLGLFGFTALLFAATLALWLATRSLVKDASANAKQQLRAYVTHEFMAWRGGFLLTGPQHVVAAPQKLAVELSLRNHGQTPAREAVLHGGVVLMPHPMLPRQKLPPLPVLARQAPTSVWPREAVPSHGWIEAAAPFSNQDVTDIGAATKRVYLYGSIEYRDVFGDVHRSRFTYFIDPASLRLVNGQPTFIWAFAEEGNGWT